LLYIAKRCIELKPGRSQVVPIDYMPVASEGP
jgi:hypothetical protein